MRGGVGVPEVGMFGVPMNEGVGDEKGVGDTGPVKVGDTGALGGLAWPHWPVRLNHVTLRPSRGRNPRPGTWRLLYW